MVWWLKIRRGGYGEVKGRVGYRKKVKEGHDWKGREGVVVMGVLFVDMPHISC